MAGSARVDDEGRGRPSSSYDGGGRLPGLAEVMSEVARSLQEEDSLEDTLNGILSSAVQIVPGAVHAGLTVVRRRRVVSTWVATADVVRQVDQAQFDAGQGPCLDAVYERRTVRLTDMRAEERWPEFTRRALDLAIRSMLSFQLFVERDDLGALSLYATEAGAFGDESENVGLLLASHAAIAMIGAQTEHDLSAALSMRDVIGQAKGILMERHKVTGDQAFHMLVRTSQRANVKLTEIARLLVETGELAGPGSPAGR